jgi:hypothetical protein
MKGRLSDPNFGLHLTQLEEDGFEPGPCSPSKQMHVPGAFRAAIPLRSTHQTEAVLTIAT